MTTLLPKEHGAYGQLTLPLVTALSVAGSSTAGWLLTASAVAAFVAHEPASILLGLRGARAARDLRRPAIGWLGCSGVIAAVTGMLAVLTVTEQVRWAMAVPIVPTLVLGVAIALDREKSWYGEMAAALAFAGLAVPVSMAAGVSLRSAVSVAVPFALLFVTSALAVRTVILRVRGGGDPQAMARTRLSTFAATGVGVASLVWLTRINLLPSMTLAAAAPGVLTAILIAARPPHPTRLRRLGWTLVAVSVLTAAIVIAMA